MTCFEKPSDPPSFGCHTAAFCQYMCTVREHKFHFTSDHISVSCNGMELRMIGLARGLPRYYCQQIVVT